MNKQILQTISAVKDARKLNPEQQHAKRNQVVELYVRGLSRLQIAAETGMSDTAVARIIKLFASGGEAALEPQLRGRRVEVKSTVDITQTIQRLICGGTMRVPKTKP